MKLVRACVREEQPADTEERAARTWHQPLAALRMYNLAMGVTESPVTKPLALNTPESFALGVMVIPDNSAYRLAARQTWIPEAKLHATVRFVAGDVPCAHQAMQWEADEHGDVAFVASDDCKKWHSPAKIHAWYTYALTHFPQASWIAKMEDDGILWTHAAVEALMTVRQHGAVYFGMMQWQGGCSLSEGSGDAITRDAQSCSGCWGGWFRGGGTPHQCMNMWRENWSGAVKEQTDDCPRFFMAPFACGPFEARSRALASAVSECEYAGRYFAAMSRRGDKKRNWCVSADGGQGHAIGACMRSPVTFADIGAERQKYATVKEMNVTRNGVLIVHPIKNRYDDPKRLPAFYDNWRFVWDFLRRTPPFRLPISVARLHFLSNETRPRITERGRTDVEDAMMRRQAARARLNANSAATIKTSSRAHQVQHHSAQARVKHKGVAMGQPAGKAKGVAHSSQP